MKTRTALATLSLAFGLALPAQAQVVIISAKNPITKLTKDQVAQIFLGQAKTFITGGMAEPIDLPETSELRKDFYQKALNKPPAQMKAYWSKLEFSGAGHAPRALANSAEVVKLVAENPKYVAYVDAAAVTPAVKVVLMP
jgi:ABC-type phosphate transport system substrate-binding protein